MPGFTLFPSTAKLLPMEQHTPSAIAPSPVGTTPSLKTLVGKLELANPVMTASGTCGYADEYADFAPLSQLGAFVTKSISRQPRLGNESYRVVETRAGMLNAIGLANIGLERFVKEKVPRLAAMNIPAIVNVPGWSIEDYVDVAAYLDEHVPVVRGIELNVSCPNVKNGLSFGTDPLRLGELVAAVRKRVQRTVLIVKLSPNVADIAITAKAAIDAGADALSLVNTFTAMAIDIETQKPVLANETGGLSGPAIKPIAVFMVNRVYRQVAAKNHIPIIAMGGVQTWQDAAEFILAGASAVAVGTALFVNPAVHVDICRGLSAYMARKGLTQIADLVGRCGTPKTPN